MKLQYWILLVFLLSSIAPGFGQNEAELELDSTAVDAKRYSFVALPIAFFLPETNFGFGGAANYSTHWKNQSLQARPSQFIVGAIYTLNKQLLLYLSYQIYSPNEKYWFRGELGYYDYVYPYYGTGQSRADENSFFFSKYPRFKIDALRQIKKNIFLGLSYRFDHYDLTGITDEQNLFQGVDLTAGVYSGLGLACVIDTRDIINNPNQGMLFDLTWQGNADFIGADYDYSVLTSSYSKYLPFGINVLALNFNSKSIFGEAPFYELALFGGGKISRGYIEGEYRADNAFSLQAEYRIRLKNKLRRFGVVLFASAGQVFDTFDELSFDYTRPAIGSGIRFLLSEEQNLNLRADVGLGSNGLQFYVTFGEAF